MKLININLKTIKDITINDIRAIVLYQQNKRTPVFSDNVSLHISDEAMAAISNIVETDLLASGEWILFENYQDWISEDKNFRAYGNNSQLSQIAIDHPEFLVSLNEPPKNPRFVYGDNWEVYFNTFMEGAKEYLESIGCLIEEKPV